MRYSHKTAVFGVIFLVFISEIYVYVMHARIFCTRADYETVLCVFVIFFINQGPDLQKILR